MVYLSRANQLLSTWARCKDAYRWEDYVYFAQQAGFSLQEISETFAGKIQPDSADPSKIEFGNWDEIIKYFTGLYFLGDPGSGKSCSMLKFMGRCTQILGAAQIVVVDWQSHLDKYPAGITVIEDEEETIRFLRWMLFEDYPKRKADLRKGIEHPLLIWVIDEVGEVTDHCSDRSKELFAESKLAAAAKDQEYSVELLRESQAIGSLAPSFLKRLGTKGRKYNYLGICGNQIASAKGNGLDGMGDALEAYVKVFTGRLVSKWAKIYGVDARAREWMEQQAYPCMADSMPALHLTHWAYQARERNQPPLDMIPVNALPTPRAWNSNPMKMIEASTAPIAPLPSISITTPRPPANPNLVTVGTQKRDRLADMETLKQLMQSGGNVSDRQKLLALGFNNGGDSREKRLDYIRELETAIKEELQEA